MKEFFEKNKTFLAIVVGAAVIGAAIYFSPEKDKKPGLTSGVQSGAEECQNIPDLPSGTAKLITKIIDGDTFLIEGGYSVRILGIDADERDHPCYDAAKNRLEELILNKEVKLEKGAEDKDQWCRYLRYAFLDDTNVSLEMAKEGLAVARLSPEDVKYREEITKAESQAKADKTGCKWSASAQASEDESSRVLTWEKLTPELTGLKLAGACEAGNYQNQEIIVEGKVAAAYRSKTNTIFFNFEKSYPNQCFTAVIFSSSQNKFVDSPEKYYSDKTVRVRGKIKEYQGKPEIILDSPAQIEMGK
jgi:micrococcal nuclease